MTDIDIGDNDISGMSFENQLYALRMRQLCAAAVGYMEETRQVSFEVDSEQWS